MVLRTSLSVVAAAIIAACGVGAKAQTPANSFPLMWVVHGTEEPGINFSGLPIERGRSVIFYEHTFGKYPRVYIHPQTGQGYVENEGIPQRTNWNAHLTKARRDVTTAIPDPEWDGYAILDFEAWTPSWAVLSNEYMKTMSRDWVRARFPGLTAAQVEARAKEEFEAAAMEFMLRTLQECKTLRPRAAWGFYGYPYHLSQEIQTQFRPLYEAIDAFYPPVYAVKFGVPDGQPAQPGQRRLSAYIADMEGKIAIARNNAPTKPIYPLVWVRYHEMNDIYGGQFINDLDLITMFRTPWRAGAKGVIFWDYIRSAAERDAYNDFFAGRGGQGLRNFLNEVNPPPAPPPPPPPTTTTTGAPPISRHDLIRAPAKQPNVRTILPGSHTTSTKRTATAPTD